MKKVQSIDEAGRREALERYTPVKPKSEHGHSQMAHNKIDKFEIGPMQTPAVKPSMGPGVGDAE